MVSVVVCLVWCEIRLSRNSFSMLLVKMLESVYYVLSRFLMEVMVRVVVVLVVFIMSVFLCSRRRFLFFVGLVLM